MYNSCPVSNKAFLTIYNYVITVVRRSMKDAEEFPLFFVAWTSKDWTLISVDCKTDYTFPPLDG